MGSNLAPGVEIIERSFSQRIEAGGNTVFGTLGLFTKGPVNERRRITSAAEFVDVFGEPNDSTYTYFFPITKMLDLAPVEVVRVEDDTKLCASVSIGLSASNVTSLSTPIHVQAYPLSYDSIFTDDNGDLFTEIVFPSGFSDSITVAAVGPGTLYNNVSTAIVNFDDYNRLKSLQISLAEAITPAEVSAVGQLTYNLAVSGNGIELSLAQELINPSDSYNVDTVLLDSYVAFENGPADNTEFGIYEFENGIFVDAYLVSNDPNKKDRFAKSMFANKVVQDNSENIRVFVSTSRTTADAITISSIGRTSLSGATTLSTDAATLTNELYGQLNNNFLSKEDVDITALIDLDFPLAIKQRMDEICQVRKDCTAILNVPADRMLNLSTGQKTNNQTSLIKTWTESTLNINSSYSALYANYFKIYDPFNDEERWIPCTGHVANRMAFTINNFEPWFAVAGLERGLVSGVLKVAFNPNDSQRKVLYPNRINTIVEFRGEGVVIWGQKTLQSVASSTDRLNVRMLLIYIARALETFSRTVIFKQNDAFSRAEWRANVGPFLNSIVQRRGITDYRVICDDSNNTKAVVARNEFQGFVIVRPTTVAEFIKIVIADVGGSLTIDEVVSGISI